jgi:hypothetical protein
MFAAKPGSQQTADERRWTTTQTKPQSAKFADSNAADAALPRAHNGRTSQGEAPIAATAPRVRSARASWCAARSSCRPRASARHCSLSSSHAKDSGFDGRVAFCAAANWAGVGSPSTTTRFWAAHSRSRMERWDHAMIDSFVTPLGRAGGHQPQLPQVDG